MILITGASSGIGKACAHILASKGHQLFLLARRQERLLAIAEELRSQFSVKVDVAQVDLSVGASIDGWLAENANKLQRIEVLINNAGMALGMGNIQEGRIEDWEQMFQTNVLGLLRLTRGILPLMIQKARGHVINVGSVAGHYNYPKGNIYCATKSAVRSLTECMRMDLLGTGLRVSSVSPGMVETEFSLVRLKDEAKAKQIYADMKPLSAQDVAEAIEWCLSRPQHVNIQDIILYPTQQAAPGMVHRG